MFIKLYWVIRCETGTYDWIESVVQKSVKVGDRVPFNLTPNLISGILLSNDNPVHDSIRMDWTCEVNNSTAKDNNVISSSGDRLEEGDEYSLSHKLIQVYDLLRGVT